MLLARLGRRGRVTAALRGAHRGLCGRRLWFSAAALWIYSRIGFIYHDYCARIRTPGDRGGGPLVPQNIRFTVLYVGRGERDVCVSAEISHATSLLGKNPTRPSARLTPPRLSSSASVRSRSDRDGLLLQPPERRPHDSNILHRRAQRFIAEHEQDSHSSEGGFPGQ